MGLQFDGFLVPPPVGVFGRSGVPTPEVPHLKVFEGLLPVPHGSQNDNQQYYKPNICLTLEMGNEGFVGGGFPDY